MSTTLRQRLASFVAAIPEGSLVPIGSVAKLMEESTPGDPDTRAPLTLEEVAARASAELFGGRRAITVPAVRKWTAQGLRGVVLEAFGRPRVVTPEAWERFVAAQQARGKKGSPPARERAASAEPADAGDEIDAMEEQFRAQQRARKQQRKGGADATR